MTNPFNFAFVYVLTACRGYVINYSRIATFYRIFHSFRFFLLFFLSVRCRLRQLAYASVSHEKFVSTISQ